MRKICCIISAGDVNSLLLKKNKNEYDYFIAADLGFQKAREIDILPQMVVGDFDSLGYLPSEYSSLNTICKQFPPEKDFTDTELAIKEGLNLGYSDFHIYGALGGDRFSHSIANIQSICQLKSRNVNAILIGLKERIYLVKNESLTLSMAPNTTFSVFSLSEKTTGVAITGAKYTLEDYTMTSDFPIGVSNESIENEVTISAKDGMLLVIEELKKA